MISDIDHRMDFDFYRPAYATARLLEQCGLTLNDIDVFELHEAFAVSEKNCVRNKLIND